jgi:hypothetical protein
MIVGTAGGASAMPVTQLAPAAKQITEGAQDARWHVDPTAAGGAPVPIGMAGIGDRIAGAGITSTGIAGVGITGGGVITIGTGTIGDPLRN